jgi:hypothetical protein
MKFSETMGVTEASRNMATLQSQVRGLLYISIFENK